MEERRTIGEISHIYGISPRTLRYYEEIGILDSHRKDSLYREYDSAQTKRLELILLLRRLSFSIRSIERILKDRELVLEEMLQEKIIQSGRDLLKLQETNRLLQDFHRELMRVPLPQLDVISILEQYSYITRETERIMAMKPPQKEENRIALGERIALDLVDEHKGNLLGEIAVLRSLLQERSIVMPKLRIYDSPDLEQDQVLIVLEGKQVLRKNFADVTPARCCDEVVAIMKAHFSLDQGSL